MGLVNLVIAVLIMALLGFAIVDVLRRSLQADDAALDADERRRAQRVHGGTQRSHS